MWGISIALSLFPKHKIFSLTQAFLQTYTYHVDKVIILWLDEINHFILYLFELYLKVFLTIYVYGDVMWCEYRLNAKLW